MTQGTHTNSPAPSLATPEDEPLLGERHPLARVIGVFKDDPMFDVMMEHIYEQRRRDEEEAQQEE